MALCVGDFFIYFGLEARYVTSLHLCGWKTINMSIISTCSGNPDLVFLSVLFIHSLRILFLHSIMIFSC